MDHFQHAFKKKGGHSADPFLLVVWMRVGGNSLEKENSAAAAGVDQSAGPSPVPAIMEIYLFPILPPTTFSSLFCWL
jgi:hypothetical protein